VKAHFIGKIMMLALLTGRVGAKNASLSGGGKRKISTM